MPQASIRGVVARILLATGLTAILGIARLNNQTVDSSELRVLARPATIPLSEARGASAPPVANATFTYGPSRLVIEVESVAHYPAQRAVVVRFRDGPRRCTQPHLVGRLSGPYVTLLTWDNVDQTADAKEMVGRYRVPAQGTYFVEIIGLLCNGLSFEADFKAVCLENPTSHRITDDFVTIDVVRTGRKLEREHSPAEEDGNETKEPTEPLLTRYQPHECHLEADDANCVRALSLDQFRPYKFVYREQGGGESSREERIRHIAETVNRKQGQNPICICFVGTSHSREMAVAVNLWLKQWGLSNIVAHGATANDFTRFPAEVTNDRAQRILKKCHQTVLGISQWSLGRKPPGGRFSGMGPTPFQDYYKQIRDMLLLLRGFEIPNLFLRSVHHNPLGNLKTTCPPEDWRYPATVDMYNEIHRNLTAELGVPFLDTSDIIGPMWDSAHDFCHYRNDETSRAEALFVLGEVLGSGG